MKSKLFRIALSVILVLGLTPFPGHAATEGTSMAMPAPGLIPAYLKDLLPDFEIEQQAVGATPVQAAAPHLDAGLIYSPVDAVAVSTTTLTLTPTGPTGYVYIWEIDYSNCAGASAVTAATTSVTTTTNLLGSPNFVHASGVTAGLCAQTPNVTFPTGLRSQNPGTAVTFVLPAVKLNQGIHFNVLWSAP